MKKLTNWPNAYKISLNVKKTDLVIFKHKNKKLECLTKIKVIGKDCPSKSLKCLAVKIDQNLNYKDQIHDTATQN